MSYLSPELFPHSLIAGLISYREQLGQFLNDYELQAIPDWELEDIRKLLQYAGVSPELIPGSSDCRKAF
jgi:hypothetical protein